MPDVNQQFEDLYGKDAKAIKEDALRELSTYARTLTKRISGGEPEPRAIAGPYSYSVKELMAQVEKETKVGRDVINAIANLKAHLARGGK